MTEKQARKKIKKLLEELYDDWEDEYAARGFTQYVSFEKFAAPALLHWVPIWASEVEG